MESLSKNEASPNGVAGAHAITPSLLHMHVPSGTNGKQDGH